MTFSSATVWSILVRRFGVAIAERCGNLAMVNTREGAPIAAQRDNFVTESGELICAIEYGPSTLVVAFLECLCARLIDDVDRRFDLFEQSLEGGMDFGRVVFSHGWCSVLEASS
jgi:hypothetical protein